MALTKQSKTILEEIYASLLGHFEYAMENRYDGIAYINFTWMDTIKDIDIVLFKIVSCNENDIPTQLFYVDHNATINKLQQTVDTFFDNNNKTLTEQEQTQFETWLFEQCFYYEPEDEELDFPKCYIDDFKSCKFIVFYED